MVVMPAVEPTTNTVTMPEAISDCATARATMRVRSWASPWPVVEILSVCVATMRCQHTVIVCAEEHSRDENETDWRGAVDCGCRCRARVGRAGGGEEGIYDRADRCHQPAAIRRICETI